MKYVNVKAEEFKDLFTEKGGSIYWEDKDFDKGRSFMTRAYKLLKFERVKLLKSYLWEYFDSINAEVYLSPYLYYDEDEGKCYTCWFEDWYKLSYVYKYKEIIKAANKDNIYLKDYYAILFREHKALAEKLFDGNTAYVSKACFIIPEYKTVFRPHYTVQLVMFGDNNNPKYKEAVKFILNKSEKLKYWVRSNE